MTPPPVISSHQHAVTQRVTLAGLVDPDSYDYLQEVDATVIDLRTAKEGTQAEARALAGKGVFYVHVPMGAGGLSAADVELLGDVLEARAEQPVVLHCASGNRAAVLWGALRVTQGADLEEVIREVEPIARPPSLEAIRKYAENLEKM